jgi:hypothetical protein
MKWLAAVTVVVACNAHAEFKTGNDLLSDLNASDFFTRGLALGYVMGTFDVGQGYLHCPPAHVTAGQVQDMVRNYLTNTPAERHLSADILVNKVLKGVWPCKSSGRGI